MVVEISSRTPEPPPTKNDQHYLEESKSILIKVNCLRNSKLVLEFKYRRPSGSRVTDQNNILNVLIMFKDRVAYQNFNASAMCNFRTQLWVGLERTIDSAIWKWSMIHSLRPYPILSFWENGNSFSSAFHLNIWEKKYVFILGGKIIFILWKCFDALMYLNVYIISCNWTFSLWMRNNCMKWNNLTSIYFDSHMNFRNDFVKQAEACDCLYMFIRLVSDIERNCNLWK